MITVLTIFLDSFSALFDRNRSESSFWPTNFWSVKYRVITYHIVMVLSCLCYNLNGQKVIELL